jgi:hypothetical protein
VVDLVAKVEEYQDTPEDALRVAATMLADWLANDPKANRGGSVGTSWRGVGAWEPGVNRGAIRRFAGERGKLLRGASFLHFNLGSTDLAGADIAGAISRRPIEAGQSSGGVMGSTEAGGA